MKEMGLSQNQGRCTGWIASCFQLKQKDGPGFTIQTIFPRYNYSQA
jgi:hypothetical protein